MENKKEKTANIDSAVNSKKAAAQSVSTGQLYEMGLEYAKELKKKEEQKPPIRKVKHIGEHSPTIID